MSVVPGRSHYTVEEYLRLEDYSNVKHEYLDGLIYAMAGGTPEHGARAMRVGAGLLAQLRGRPCNVYSSDVRVRVVATGLDTYPDVSVVCGAEERDAEDKNAIVNPIVLVEILSAGTEDYDRGEKLDQYKTIPSLREIVLVDHREAAVEIWRRESTGTWSRELVARGGQVALASIACKLDVDEIYADPLRKP